jgi:hypothetical protein
MKRGFAELPGAEFALNSQNCAMEDTMEDTWKAEGIIDPSQPRTEAAC